MTVANKVTIISGASGGLGTVVSQKFHLAGAAVVLVGTRPDAVETLAEALGRDRTLPIAADLVEPAGAAEVVAATLKHFGRVDILLNLAGGFTGGKLTGDSALDDLERMLDINVRTTYNLCRAAVKPMIDQNWGRIVNTGSRAALRGQAGLSAYAMSKAAVLRLTESLAAELRDYNITVNAILPGTIDTEANRQSMPQADFSQWVKPAVIADTLLFLVQEETAINGAALPVYGQS